MILCIFMNRRSILHWLHTRSVFLPGPAQHWKSNFWGACIWCWWRWMLMKININFLSQSDFKFWLAKSQTSLRFLVIIDISNANLGICERVGSAAKGQRGGALVLGIFIIFVSSAYYIWFVCMLYLYHLQGIFVSSGPGSLYHLHSAT